MSLGGDFVADADLLIPFLVLLLEMLWALPRVSSHPLYRLSTDIDAHRAGIAFKVARTL